MRKHGLTVMETIDTAIGLLEDEKMSELTDTLIDLGIVHNMKQVQLESFAVSLGFFNVFLLDRLINYTACWCSTCPHTGSWVE